MYFYLLSLIFVLTSIFGIAHSQLASDRLQLQEFYNRSLTTILQQLNQNNALPEPQISHSNTQEIETIDAPEIINEPLQEIPIETKKIEEISRESKEMEEIHNPETIQEIEEIRLRVKEESNIQMTFEDLEEDDGDPAPDDQDEVLAAITESLRKLSSAASSGRINGFQLYNILLRETMLHNRTLNRGQSVNEVILEELNEDDLEGAATSNSNDTTTVPSASNALQVASEKPRMYFGEKPLEYVSERIQ